MEKVEYYTLRPNLKQIYGKKVDETTEFKEQTEDGSVHQTFKNLTLITEIKKKEDLGKIKVEEESKITIKVPSGTVLIWNEQEGFIIPQYQMCTLEEIEEDIKSLKEIYKGDTNDSKGNENKNI